MPGAAIIATQLQGSSSNAKGLYIAGFDVMKQPGTGLRYGVPVETIRVVENGPGGVSAMSFVIDDPGLAVTVRPGQEVRFHDLVRNAPIFLGFVQACAIEPAFGDQGRSIRVECVGIEAILDWAVTSVDLAFPANDTDAASVGIQRIVANSVGLGELRALANPGNPFGNQALPIGDETSSVAPDALLIPAGTTVREAIRMVVTSGLDVNNTGLGGSPEMITVDFYRGLRAFVDHDLFSPGLIFEPDDYATFTVVDTPASGTVAEGLTYSVDGSVPRSVMVVGTGIVYVQPDGSGALGQVAVIEDSTITTRTAAQAAAAGYLTSFAEQTRGTFRRIAMSPPAGVQAGSILALTDARAALNGAQFRIMQIDKEFLPGNLESWTVAFGGLPPSVTRYLRRLTRSTRS